MSQVQARPNMQQNGDVNASPSEIKMRPFEVYSQMNFDMRPSLDWKSKRRCGPRVNTADRLFGTPENAKRTPKVNDTFRSSIFDTSKPSPPATPKKKAVPVMERNPVTGEVKAPAKVQV